MRPPASISGQTFAFPAGGGELGRLIREHDWSKTSLGPIDAWPSYWRTAVDICLQAPVPVVMLWGPDGILVYNDAYAGFAADRHPALLGSKVLEGWPEASDLNRTVLDECFHAGRTLTYKDLPLTLYRNKGEPDNLWVDLSYSPILDETGNAAAVIAIVLETTGKVLAETALAEERRMVLEANLRLTAESTFLRGLFEQAPSFMCITTGPQHHFALANATYMALVGRTDLLGKTVDEGLPGIRDQGFIDELDRVFSSGEPFLAAGARVMLARTPGAPPEERFVDFIHVPIRSNDGAITGIFTQGQDVTERTHGERHLHLLINELNHRVKNTLAIIQSIAAQTFRSSENLPQAQAAFSARIMALARANDLLTGENWEGSSLLDVVATAAGALGHADRIHMSGPPVRLSPKTAMSISMGIHELATNALKYGALSDSKGRVDVSWTMAESGEGSRFHLEWRESGGPLVSPPAVRGFGSKLIERGLAGELGGIVELRFEPSGVSCIIDAPLDQYAGTPI